eukprot:14932_1
MSINKRSESSNEPPAKRQKRNLMDNEVISLCKHCNERRSGEYFGYAFNTLDELCSYCYDFKYRNKREFWKSITFNSTTSDILNHCNKSHQHNPCKRQCDTLCDACNEFIHQKNKYSKAIENNLKVLLPMKNILLSYLMCSKVPYFNNVNDAKYQLMMDEWHNYSLRKNNLNKSVNILKKMMKNLSIDNFIDLLFNLQPWLNVTQLSEILDFQVGNAGLMQIKPRPVPAYKGLLNQYCNGCVSANLGSNVMDKCWICHMAIKTMLLMYFVVDLFEDNAEYFRNFENFIRDHSVVACARYWSVVTSSWNLFGCHVIKDHIIHEIKKLDSDCFLLIPPIIDKETLKKIQMEMLTELKRGWDDGSHIGNAMIQFNGPGVWVCDEMGNQRLVSV